MAYIVEIVQSKCFNCGKKATHTVFNRVNANMGDYCHKCALAAVKRQNEYETRENQRNDASRRILA